MNREQVIQLIHKVKEAFDWYEEENERLRKENEKLNEGNLREMRDSLEELKMSLTETEDSIEKARRFLDQAEDANSRAESSATEAEMSSLMKCNICGYDPDTRTPPDHEFCEEEFENFICTREKGHDGKHVACGTIDHPILIWDGDSEEYFL